MWYVWYDTKCKSSLTLKSEIQLKGEWIEWIKCSEHVFALSKFGGFVAENVAKRLMIC